MPETSSAPSKKIFYGWIAAIAGGVAVFAAANFQYTFGVFVKPLADSFGWSRAAISAAATARAVTSMTFAPLVGTWSDRYGPRMFVLCGVVIVGLGYLVASKITNIWQMYLSLGFMVGLGLTCAFIPAVATATRWFGRKSALPVGIVMSGFGVSQIILPPLATFLILRYSWQFSFIVLAIIVWITGITAWRFIKNPPPGDTGKPADRTQGSPAAASSESDFTLKEALRHTTMWILLIINMGLFLCYQMMIIHVVPAAIQTGISAEAAAIILTLSGVTNTAGRLALSFLAGRIGSKVVLVLCFGLQAISLLSLSLTRELYVFYAGAMVYGLTYGGVIAIMPSLAGNYFGTRAIGAIYSVLNIAQNVGMAIGPLLAGYVFDITGSYFQAFFSAAISLGIVLVLCLRLKPPLKKTLNA